jgi:hypothetical protein
LGVRDGGEGEESEDREEEDLGKILPRAPLLLCVQAQEDKGKGLEMEREQREREKGGRLGLPSWLVCKERGKKREQKKKKEEFGRNSLEI